jgi:hypothetical protein
MCVDLIPGGERMGYFNTGSDSESMITLIYGGLCRRLFRFGFFLIIYLCIY